MNINKIDFTTYTIAAEKMGMLLYVLEQTMNFMEEYEIEPDQEVKKELMPLIKKMQMWIEAN